MEINQSLEVLDLEGQCSLRIGTKPCRVEPYEAVKRCSPEELNVAGRVRAVPAVLRNHAGQVEEPVPSYQTKPERIVLDGKRRVVPTEIPEDGAAQHDRRGKWLTSPNDVDRLRILVCEERRRNGPLVAELICQRGAGAVDERHVPTHGSETLGRPLQRRRLGRDSMREHHVVSREGNDELCGRLTQTLIQCCSDSPV